MSIDFRFLSSYCVWPRRYRHGILRKGFPSGYTKEQSETPTQGVVSGITIYTINVKNFGGADAATTVSLTPDALKGIGSGTLLFFSAAGPGISAPGAGTNCVTSDCTVTWSNLISPGSEITLTVTVVYDSSPDDTKIDAGLTSTYKTTDDFPRESSGSPALIQFTTQLD